MSDISQYIKDLESMVSELEKKIKKIEEEIMQVKLKFELKKNDLQDDVSRELGDYNPQGLSVSFENDGKNFEVANGDVNNCLKNIFKIS